VPNVWNIVETNNAIILNKYFEESIQNTDKNMNCDASASHTGTWQDWESFSLTFLFRGCIS
jgi:hypothetical protein